jgi:C-terminal processing protease CtpA/Prc
MTGGPSTDEDLLMGVRAGDLRAVDELSVSHFEAASGEMRQGVGVAPDVHIPEPADFHLGAVRDLDPAGDAVLAAASQLLAAE